MDTKLYFRPTDTGLTTADLGVAIVFDYATYSLTGTTALVDGVPAGATLVELGANAQGAAYRLIVADGPSIDFSCHLAAATDVVRTGTLERGVVASWVEAARPLLERTRGLLVSAAGLMKHPHMFKIEDDTGFATSPPNGYSLGIWFRDEATGVDTLIGTQSFDGTSFHCPDLWVGNPAFTGPVPAGSLLLLDFISADPRTQPSDEKPYRTAWLGPDVTGTERWIKCQAMTKQVGEKFFVTADGLCVESFGLRGSVPGIPGDLEPVETRLTAAVTAARDSVNTTVAQLAPSNGDFVFLNDTLLADGLTPTFSISADPALPAATFIELAVASKLGESPRPLQTLQGGVESVTAQTIAREDRLTYYVETGAAPLPATTITLTPTAGAVVTGTIVFKVPAMAAGYNVQYYVASDGGLLLFPMGQRFSGGLGTPAGASIAADIAAISTGGGAPTGPGSDAVTLTVVDGNGDPVADCEVWITSDAAGNTVIAGPLRTGDNGAVTTPFMLTAGQTYYAWRRKAGMNFANPVTFVAVAD